MMDAAIKRCSFIRHLHKILEKHLRGSSTMAISLLQWLLLELRISSSEFLFITQTKTYIKQNRLGFSENHLLENAPSENTTIF